MLKRYVLLFYSILSILPDSIMATTTLPGQLIQFFKRILNMHQPKTIFKLYNVSYNVSHYVNSVKNNHLVRLLVLNQKLTAANVSLLGQGYPRKPLDLAMLSL